MITWIKSRIKKTGTALKLVMMAYFSAYDLEMAHFPHKACNQNRNFASFRAEWNSGETGARALLKSEATDILNIFWDRKEARTRCFTDTKRGSIPR